MAARLSAVAQELEVRQRSSFNRPDAPIEPELDQFMVIEPGNKYVIIIEINNHITSES